MDLSQIFGIHSVCYFYGVEHLAINMSPYIMEGIKNNELIYLSMEPQLRANLLNLLNLTDKEQVRFGAMDELVEAHKARGFEGLHEAILELTAEAQSQGYRGVRYIGQPIFTVEERSIRAFLAWEDSLARALKETQFSLICIYDMMDYLHEKQFVNDEVIKISLQGHPHLLYQQQLEEMESIQAS